MKVYRCRCGQTLAGFATGFAETGLPFSPDFIDRAVDEALDRHRGRLSAYPPYRAEEHGRAGRSEADWMEVSA